MTPTDVDKIPGIVDGVREAFRSGKTRPLSWRNQQLRGLVAMLTEKEDAFLEALSQDLGKSSFEGWLSEVKLVINEAEHTMEYLPAWARPERVPTPLFLKPGHCKVYREPLGAALIISPWNYPLQLALAPLVSAIGAGNTAVIKPSELAEATSQVIADMLPRYLDEDAFAVVQGGIPETTKVLEQRFDHIFYTGNGHVGRIIMRAAAEHLTPVTLELGGKSPCIVDRSVNMKVAVKRIIWGKFFNAGQTCVAPDYVLAHKDLAGELETGLKQTIREFFGDKPEDSADYGRIVNDRHFERLSKLLDGGEIIIGGDTDAETRFIAPTLMKGVTFDSPVMQDEIFGPILPILEIDSIDAAIDIVNEHDKPLALYVFSDDKQVQTRILDCTSSGGGCVNDAIAHLGVPDLPFGGVGASGMGAYHGRHGFEAFSHRKGVLHKSTLIDPSLRYPPYTEGKTKWVRRLA